MSDENRNDAGQYTSAEPLFGKDHEEAKAGFKPMPDARKPDEDTPDIEVKEAAERLLERRAREAGPIKREYIDAETGERISPTETITIERAAEDLALVRTAEADVETSHENQAIADAVDHMREKYLEKNPDNAKELGIDPPEKADVPEATDTKPAKVEAKAETISASPDLDAIERVFNEHPQVKQAIDAKFEAAEQTQRAYATACDAAENVTLSAFVGMFPEFQHIPPEAYEIAVQTLRQQNPQRFAQLTGFVEMGKQIASMRQHHASHEASREREAFTTYAKSESSRFDAMMEKEGISKERRSDLAKEIISAVHEYTGIDDKEFANLLMTDKIAANAGFQRLLIDAAMWRQASKAKNGLRIVPPVNRPVVKPGNGAARLNPNTESIRALQQQVATASGPKAAKLQAQIIAARRRG